MTRVERLIKLLEAKYLTPITAETGTKYWDAPKFKIRLSNHLATVESLNASKFTLNILVPYNSGVFVVAMGQVVYTFTSVNAVMHFVECLELTIPIVIGAKLTPVYGASVFKENKLVEKHRVLKQQFVQIQSILKKVQNQLPEKHRMLVNGLLKLKAD